MTIFSELFGSELEKKQDDLLAKEIVTEFAKLLNQNEKYGPMVINSIKDLLSKWQQDKDKRQLVHYILKELMRTFPILNKKYSFEI